MIKGCERRMIKIEDPESEAFEAAYFIIRQNAPTPISAGRKDLLCEAIRIAEGKTATNRCREKRKSIISRAVFFLSGALLSALVFLLIYAL